MSTIESVVVRMYRNLLGDCFLIRVNERDGPERRILIDCGLLQGLDDGKDRIRAVAADIITTCSKGGVPIPEGCDALIDLLVVTHQHFDHVGGFIQAPDILLGPKVAYGQLWMAWTEDPTDPKAVELRKDVDDRKAAVTKLAAAFKQNAGLDTLVGDPTEGLDAFIGPIEGEGLALDGERRLTVSAVMDAIKAKIPNVSFLIPGQVVDTPGTASLRAVTLGPPKADSRLFKDLPSRGENKETYLAEEMANQSLLAANADAGQPAQLDRKPPFPSKYWRGLERDQVAGCGDATSLADHDEGTVPPARWAYDHYFASADPLEGLPQTYRRIDSDWTQSATALALNLDSDTNNTSLVLAFQLPDDSFMLFAADAQVGNWLSWHDQGYTVGSEQLTAQDILGRTRLYKVGHHGSHNATLRGKGLEMMTHDTLIALCSTVEEEALQQGKGWLMPNPEVKKQLLAHCQGRVIRGDRRWQEDPDIEPHRAENAGFDALMADGPAMTIGAAVDQPLYVELEMYRKPSSKG